VKTTNPPPGFCASIPITITTLTALPEPVSSIRSRVSTINISPHVAIRNGVTYLRQRQLFSYANPYLRNISRGHARPDHDKLARCCTKRRRRSCRGCPLVLVSSTCSICLLSSIVTLPYPTCRWPQVCPPSRLSQLSLFLSRHFLPGVDSLGDILPGPKLGSGWGVVSCVLVSPRDST